MYTSVIREGRGRYLVLPWGQYVRSWTHLLRVREMAFKDEEAFAHDQQMRDLGKAKDLHETVSGVHGTFKEQTKSSVWWRKEDSVQYLGKGTRSFYVIHHMR